ncbi:MAG: hypothetical protein NXH88_15585 [Hyphomonas sp.]|nr:hypothetical protein [Hyphomonas sp.]
MKLAADERLFRADGVEKGRLITTSVADSVSQVIWEIADDDGPAEGTTSSAVL